MSIFVAESGFVTTVQDLGRVAARIGVPRGGAMDRFALAAANRLVGNPEGAAGLEFVLDGPVIITESDCLLAAAGGGFSLMVNGVFFPPWMTVLARRGSVVRLIAADTGTWGYLAFSGGLDVPPVMGSRGTYLRAGLGGWHGRALAAGDRLPLGGQRKDLSLWGGRSLPNEYLPNYSLHPVIRCVQGPQWDKFSETGKQTFFGEGYELSLTADRMGYRLVGASVEHTSGADILSDGMAAGAVQIPANGQPIVMMSDCQTAGGYTKIAVVITADLPVLAQCRPGVSRIQFEITTIEAAQSTYRRQVSKMLDGLALNRDSQLEESRF